MALGQINRKIIEYGEAEEPTGNHVILRIPNPIRTAAQRRECHVTGLQFGRVIRRVKNPMKVKVYREKGYWVHELEEFQIWAAEKDFVQSRVVFLDVLLHTYERFMAMEPGKATRGALEKKRQFQETFSFEEIVA